MLAKTIKYTDFLGQKREEEFLFNFSKAELTQIELERPGGLSGHIARITKETNQAEIIKQFQWLITESYGTVSEDGKRFMKDPKKTKEFMETEAYSNLYMELLQDAEEAAKFVKGIMPQAMQVALNDHNSPS